MNKLEPLVEIHTKLPRDRASSGMLFYKMGAEHKQ